MSSHEIQTALWVSQPVLQAFTAIALYRRGLHKQFPAFFAYFPVQILVFLISFPINQHSALYFDVYYAWVALNVIFAFKIIHEVFLDVFRPYPALKDLGTALFKWAAMIMMLVSVVMIALSPSWDEPIRQSILIVQRCVDVIQCGLVIFLLAFCQSLGVSWRRPSFGIVLGFGLFSGVELLVLALYSGLHMHIATTSMIDLLAYESSLFAWLAYSLLQERQATVPVLVPQRWDNALMDIQPHDESDSLIPMFEHMVEQALSKTQNQQV
jgi:hypothetical protein